MKPESIRIAITILHDTFLGAITPLYLYYLLSPNPIEYRKKLNQLIINFISATEELAEVAIENNISYNDIMNK